MYCYEGIVFDLNILKTISTNWKEATFIKKNRMYSKICKFLYKFVFRGVFSPYLRGTWSYNQGNLKELWFIPVLTGNIFT
nr:hypothetical protein XNA1_2100002 [Xenorhabdus nematophila str. Anatoliense]